MIQHRTGSLFDSGADALVDPVNCVGTHGKGLALEFKKRFPWAMAIFADQLLRRGLRPGNVIAACRAGEPQIVFFPTKDHWRSPSRLEWIESGLDALVEYCEEAPDVSTIAIPALGCGLGGLDWDVVRPLIEATFAKTSIVAMVYGPFSALRGAPKWPT